CGGEDIDGCNRTIQELHRFGIGTILDYSVEGSESESDFDATHSEILATIKRAHGDTAIPFCVFKPTGIGRFALLEKKNSGRDFDAAESAEYDRFVHRLENICSTAHQFGVPVFVDAEESWIQDVIDSLVLEMMRRFNKQKAIVYNTVQLYRHDRLGYLRNLLESARSSGFKVGVKLVRGAYMEKERLRAKSLGYQSPIQPDKSATDRDYDLALQLCLQHLDFTSIVAGTHNESSSAQLVDLMKKNGLSPEHPGIWFSQLYGMSDHISFNLAKAGFNVCKYVPYGPVKAVLPYLIRRAQENTSVKGQTGRELSLIESEMRRRRG
ncbi:MAG: proline dehydrogenase family protein, partial [Bacteroidota bacterium]